MAVVYQHRRKDTGEIFYIGIGKTQRRAYIKQGRGTHWERIAEKIGYSVEILETDLTWEQACRKEVELIAFHGRLDFKTGRLINKTNGGEGQVGAIISEERRLKQSKALKGRPGKPHTLQTKQLISKLKLGIPRSYETRKKLAEACKGRVPWNKGRTMPKGWSSLTGKQKTKVKCPHCNLSGSPNNMNRWHFENCKNKV